MWTKCQIKVLDPERSGVSMSGNDWVRQRCVLAWQELDGQGQPVMDHTNQPVVSKANFELAKNRIDELKAMGAQVGSMVWADLRCNTETRTSQKGNAYVTNELYVSQFAKVQ